MAGGTRRAKGFTLIELAVTLTVALVLAMIALPSFEGMRQRAAVKGAANQLLSFWSQARLEAVKRNSMVKVGVVQANSGAQFCLGAATTTDSLDDTPCDCREAAPSDATTTCDVARFPADMTTGQDEWNRVTLGGVTLGGGTLITAIEPAVIEPKRATLTVSADDGTISLLGPPGQFSYKMNLSVDKFGRAVICQSTASTHDLPDYADKQCAD
jgi:prepilin-type N-terminal cleavage/methylation domain-containing protein